VAAKAAVSFDVQGFTELRRAFSRFPDRVERKVLKDTVTSSATPIISAIRSRVPRGGLGHLRRNIKMRVTMHAQNSVASAAIGARSTAIPVSRDKRWTKTGRVVPSKYAHLVEFGTKAGVRAYRFLEAGFAAGEPRAREKFKTAFARVIDREARKLGFK